MKTQEKKLAVEMRKQGKSMNDIVKELKVSKGSVSLWVRDVKLNREQRKALSLRGFSIDAIEKRRINRLRNEHNKRMLIMEEAKKDIRKPSDYELKIIGAMLYLGEGGKTERGSVRISNADPEVIKIMMKFFRRICMVKEEKFRGHIHIHSHLNVKKAEEYWSKISSIPTSQFYKTYTKPSISSKGKKDSLPLGTFDIYVCDTKLFLTIMGWIEQIKTLALK
jgi:transposase